MPSRQQNKWATYSGQGVQAILFHVRCAVTIWVVCLSLWSIFAFSLTRGGVCRCQFQDRAQPGSAISCPAIKVLAAACSHCSVSRYPPNGSRHTTLPLQPGTGSETRGSARKRVRWKMKKIPGLFINKAPAVGELPNGSILDISSRGHRGITSVLSTKYLN